MYFQPLKLMLVLSPTPRSIFSMKFGGGDLLIIYTISTNFHKYIHLFTPPNGGNPSLKHVCIYIFYKNTLIYMYLIDRRHWIQWLAPIFGTRKEVAEQKEGAAARGRAKGGGSLHHECLYLGSRTLRGRNC